MRIGVCNLGKTGIILEMPWLQAHNSEINQKTREVQIMRYLPLCGRNKEKEDKREKEYQRKRKLLDGQQITKKTREEKKKQRQTTEKSRRWSIKDF